MFGLFKSLTKAGVKNSSDLKGFSNAFEDVQKSKEKINQNLDDKDKSYTLLINKGISYLKVFSEENDKQNDINLLHEAAKYFTDAIELKKHKAEAYFYLAYIFHLIDKNDYALNYLKVVSCIDPEYPNLKNLKEKIANTEIKIKKESSVRSITNSIVTQRKNISLNKMNLKQA
ncbi:MAG: tetratricopeptide repeat protein [Candidatus Sericytochromatia bacterium]